MRSLSHGALSLLGGEVRATRADANAATTLQANVVHCALDRALEPCIVHIAGIAHGASAAFIRVVLREFAISS